MGLLTSVTHSSWLSMFFMVSRVCYERASFSPTIQTFFLSAIWHGVYPGYYLTFLTGVLMTLAARTVSTTGLFYTWVVTVHGWAWWRSVARQADLVWCVRGLLPRRCAPGHARHVSARLREDEQAGSMYF